MKKLIYIQEKFLDPSQCQTFIDLAKKNKHTHGILFSKNFGKSQALNAGFKLAKGDSVITMDADLQDSPDEIIKMIKTLKEKKLDKKIYLKFLTLTEKDGIQKKLGTKLLIVLRVY